MRLYCFPYAGGGPAIFHAWQKHLPADIEVRAPCLPGRGRRLGERPVSTWPEVLSTFADQLLPGSEPFAFFGHSLGALMAFELARHLRRQESTGPSRLVVSARAAPRVPKREPPLHRLPDAAFLAALEQRYRRIPAAVLANREMLDLLLPGLRADFELFETYRYTPEDPLDCPITVFGGTDDQRSPRPDLELWNQETRSASSLRLFPGGHFFFEDDLPGFLGILAAELRATFTTAP